MGFLIGFLTVILALDCLLLILLILIQLPKKEAGMGTAFGGQATDALFGAGTGNALTQITKYAAGAFFVLAIVLATLNANQSPTRGSKVKEALKQAVANPAPIPTAPAGVPAGNAATPKPAVGPASMLLSTNAPAAPAPAGTNAAQSKK
jgi:preprotein translocase subunit SecG